MASTSELLDLGLSKRQVVHWVDRGYLTPSNGRPGQGVHLTFEPAEVEVARIMALLVGAGFTPKAAHDIARRAQQSPAMGSIKISLTTGGRSLVV
jgi:DNA-binding transcriptional MerR regulator